MDNLEDFLKGPETEEVVEEAVAEPVVEEVAAEPTEPTADRPRGPDGKFLPKGEKQAEEAASVSPTPQDPPLDHPALIGERRRRQEAEAEIERLRTQAAPLAVQPQPQGLPDRWEDPEGYDQYLIAKAGAIAQEQAVHAVQTQRIYQSALNARAKYADYGDAHAVFGEMVQSNPGLFHQMLHSPDPAEFAYTTAKTEMEIRQYGGIDKLVEARVQARLAETQPAITPTPTIPDTLADAQSARGSSSAQPFTVPSLDQILGRTS